MNWMDVESPLGPLRLTGRGDNLTGVYFLDGRYVPSTWGEPAALPVFGETARWLAHYFAGEEPERMPRIAVEGTAFQKAVWAVLSEIPMGDPCPTGRLQSVWKAVWAVVWRRRR